MFVVIVLFLYLISGFNNLKVLDNVKVGLLSVVFSMYYNFDKVLVFFILFVCLFILFVVKKYFLVSWFGWLGLIVSIFVLLLLVVVLGGLKVEMYIFVWVGFFVMVNIFFVCLVEEVLFCGYL